MIKKTVKTATKPDTTAKQDTKEVAEYKTLYSTEVKVTDNTNIVFSILQRGDEEPTLDIRTFLSTDRYTGMTKKGVNVPISLIFEMNDALNDVLQQSGEYLEEDE